MRRLGRAAAGLWAVAVLAACKDSAAPEAGLNVNQAASLAQQLAGAAVTALATASPGAAGGTASTQNPVPQSYRVQGSLACAQSGTIDITGTITGNIESTTGTGTLAVNATQALKQCVLTIGGTQYVVNATLGLFGNYVIVNWVVLSTQTASLAGDVSYASTAGGSGTCTLDLTITYQTETATFTVAGTACDHSISF